MFSTHISHSHHLTTTTTPTHAEHTDTITHNPLFLSTNQPTSKLSKSHSVMCSAAATAALSALACCSKRRKFGRGGPATLTRDGDDDDGEVEDDDESKRGARGVSLFRDCGAVVLGIVAVATHDMAPKPSKGVCVKRGEERGRKGKERKGRGRKTSRKCDACHSRKKKVPRHDRAKRTKCDRIRFLEYLICFTAKFKMLYRVWHCPVLQKKLSESDEPICHLLILSASKTTRKHC